VVQKADKMTKVSLELRAAGYCTAGRHHALKGAKRETIRFYATFALISHPDHGYVLFDTGYTSRFYEETARFPYSIYRRMTPVTVEKEEEVVSQLAAMGIAPGEITYIIISHFHADHLGGVKDFPKAQFISSRLAYESVKGKTGWSAVRRGFLPGHLPDNFEERLTLIDFDETAQTYVPGPWVDLFEDGSIKLCLLEGHAKGQMGALIDATTKPFFLIADAAWLKAHYESDAVPHGIVRLFFDSWKNYLNTLKNLRTFRHQHPEVEMVATHCRETYEQLKGKQF
jgi:glyoxylase-like metal-dependent hydrolase (beta-lactamase superfamily II)